MSNTEKKYASLNTLRIFLENLGNKFAAKTDVEELSSEVAYINLTDNEDVTDLNGSTTNITIDSFLSNESTNPVQNKVVTEAINQLSDNKLDKPTTAAVGQVIAVKSVDDNGKPVKLEAVDMSSVGSSSVQSDYEQSDETAADYIKNRPFYEGFELEVRHKNVVCTLAYKEGWSACAYNPVYVYGITFNEGIAGRYNPIVGETYMLVVDGTRYIDEVKYDSASNGTYYIGNPALAVKTGEDNGLPFALIQDAVYDSTGYLVGKELGTYTVSLYRVLSREVKQMDEKFIPDSIARVSDIPEQVLPDFSQNDETAPDYIKNRTHWVEVEEGATFLPETTVTTVDGYAMLSQDSQQFVVGEVYNVTFNGTVYDCVARVFEEESGSTIIGNGAIFGDGIEGNGEPFSCDSYDDGSIYINVETDGEYTISITGNKFTYKTIDIPYLPPEALVGKPGEGRFSEVFNASFNSARGDYAHAEGEEATAEGYASHAEGAGCYAGGNYSHSEGADTSARGEASHAEGAGTRTKGYASHAEGYFTIASGDCSHVQGKYNIEDTDNRYAHIVGNGESEENCSNAHTLDWDGNAWYAGSVEGTALILSSPSGTRYQIMVDDNGSLSATPITE